MNHEKILFLAPGVEIEVIDNREVLLVGLGNYKVLVGDLVGAIFQTVGEGLALRQEVVASLSHGHEAERVEEIITKLVSDGFLIEAQGVDPLRALLWQSLDWPIATVRDALVCAGIRLTTLGPSLEPLSETLGRWGICLDARVPMLYLVLVDDLTDERLAAFQAERDKEGVPWMLLYASSFVMAATLFVPGQSPCWHCLARALTANMYRPGQPRLRTRLVDTQASWRVGFYEKTAARVVGWLVEERLEVLEGNLIVQKGDGLAEEHHPIRSTSACRRCSPASPRPYDGQAFMATLQQEGRRSESAESPVALLQSWLSPVTGKMWDLRPATHLDPDLGYVYTIRHHLGHMRKALPVLRQNTQVRSLGKGRTPAEAEQSTFGEVAERLSGIWRPGRPVIRSTFKDLPGHGLHPDALLGYSKAQQQTRKTWNAATPFPMLRVPPPYDEDAAIEWVEGWSLIHNIPCYVPAALTFYDHPDSRFGRADSSGCAAGSSLADALLSGFFEVLERDGISQWWFRRLCLPGLDLESFQDPWIRQQQKAHQRLGRELWALDLTTDLEVPVVAAVSRAPHGWAVGFGCHWEVGKAMTSALLEVSQLLAVHGEHEVSIADGPLGDEDTYLWPCPHQPARCQASYIQYEDGWPSVGQLVERLALRGFEAVVVDQTDPDIGLPVVRVIVPGLGHHWRRLGVKRLYQEIEKIGTCRFANKGEKFNQRSLVL